MLLLVYDICKKILLVIFAVKISGHLTSENLAMG